MSIKENIEGDVVVLSLKGNLMGDPETTELRDKVKSVVGDGLLKIVLDVSKVKWMNSSGLGAMISALATANNAEAMAATVGGLGPEGQLVAVGVTPENLPISPLDLINSGLSVIGHPSGTSRDVEETMHFALLSGVRAVVEERPLTEAAEAFERMDSGNARYRVVLTV